VSRIVRRLASCLVVVWAVVSLTFLVETMLPGDPGRLIAGAQARPADVARIREQLGLNRPLPVQYALFWKRLVHVGPGLKSQAPGSGHDTCVVVVPFGARALHVDLGKSFQVRQPVAAVIATRVPRTVALAIAGVTTQLLFGLLVGVTAAARRGSRWDRFLVGASLLGVSIPTFVIALLLQYALAYRLRWLPLDGFGTSVGEHARCLVLPALTLGLYGAPYYARLVRDEMSLLIRQDWVRTARAKGLSRWGAIMRHAFRNALTPVVTAVGLDLGTLMGGAIVTESVFRWPGLGDLSVKATLNRDGPVVLACVIVTSTAIVASNFVADLLCEKLDPKSDLSS
jgi:peptide/nickel transport system permease protein